MTIQPFTPEVISGCQDRTWMSAVLRKGLQSLEGHDVKLSEHGVVSVIGNCILVLALYNLSSLA